MDEHHVVMVGRFGDHPGTSVYLTESGTRREAILSCEATFRKEQKFAKSVALLSQILFSGSLDACEIYFNLLNRKMAEKEQSNG